MDKLPKYFRQKESGHIYVATELLAARDDMEPYDMVDVEIVEEKSIAEVKAEIKESKTLTLPKKSDGAG